MNCLKRVTFELADLQRRSQLSVVFIRLLCRYYVLTVVFQPLLEEVADCTTSQFQMRYPVFVRVLPLSL